MDNYQGDLTDILRASGGAAPVGSSDAQVGDQWQFPSSDPMNIIEEPSDNFGDPFSNMQDPLLNELDMATSSFFNNTPNSAQIIGDTLDFGGSMVGQRVLEQDEMNTSGSCNNSSSSSMFSRMMISQNPTMPLPSVPPCDSPSPAVMAAAAAAASPRSIKSPVIVGSDMINANSSKGNCLVDNTGLQISSPRNPGIKRRKSQAKKVVCIPAPAAANGRPGGEVVPSDLWAWRKYGQKPIKGSPYPRGYYRCSSSKGCSARKQVERSRTDPNMLVITYTSEHNHPWPTQRNALAGSTRSQASKANATSKSSPSSHAQKTITTMKEEQNDNNVSTNVAATSITGGSVKEETTDQDIEKQLDIEDADFVEEFCQGYIPTLPDSSQSEDLFADLRELEADPLNLIFSQGLTGDEHLHKEGSNKSLDPFSLFDWSEGKYNNNNSPFGDK